MFDDNKFSLQIIAKGAFVDDGVENGKLYIVEATTVRLNHVAPNEWNRSECLNTRECYKDGHEGDAEWEAHKAEYAQRRKLWEEKLLKALGIYPPKRGRQNHTSAIGSLHGCTYLEGKSGGYHMNRRYRICARCQKRWNVSCIGANPKRYICPHCEKKEAVPRLPSETRPFKKPLHLYCRGLKKGCQ